MSAGSNAASRILIASDDRDLNAALAGLLSQHAPAIGAGARPSVLAEVTRDENLRLVIIGEISVDSTALDLLHAIKQQRPDVAVLLLSAHPTVEHAAESIRRGAEDFVPIPYSEELVLKEVARILEAAELRDRVENLDQLVATRYGFERVVSRSTRMRAVFDRANAASRSDTPVLIVGETGTGKELIARAIHANSRRSKRPFVPINCAALPRDLVESEIFGHRRGAFSGAFADHAGLFVAAHGGSLFLDEIGELPLDVQAKLLRVLQDGDVRPVGGLESRRVDVRIIAASNRSLAEMRDNRMRQDLFFRISVLVIEIPPLRERREDLPLLLAHFLGVMRGRGVRHIEGIDPQALDVLADYAFPGNVRELENMLEGIAVVLPPDRATIRAEDLRAWLRRRGAPVGNRTSDATGVPLNLNDLEKWAIREALQQAHGNKSKAAQMLGISRDTLYRKLHELGVTVELSDSQAQHPNG
ncbi:MAG: sigma-54-dependent Fis family transcriptional regulator [Acidobacteria bacterium]|nr:sigma-54-dependent Fis family transcriptional regulator [Acidobacteriota bacterium]